MAKVEQIYYISDDEDDREDDGDDGDDEGEEGAGAPQPHLNHLLLVIMYFSQGGSIFPAAFSHIWKHFPLVF